MLGMSRGIAAFYVPKVWSLAVYGSLAAGMVSGCSSDNSQDAVPTSTASDASGTPSATVPSGQSSEAEGANSEHDATEPDSNTTDPDSNTTNSESNATEPDSNTTNPESTGVVDPGTPLVLASEVVFGARLCLGANDQLYYPNRIGYPQTPGLEQLWVVATTGGDARVLGTPGSVTGCVQVANEVWTASYDTAAIARVDVDSGGLLPSYPTTGTPLQVTGNSSRVFASLNMQSSGGAVVSIDPTTLGQPETLWSKAGRVTALWLHANDDRLLFSARDAETMAAWIVQVRMSPVQVTELVGTTGELGGVDGAGDFAYYTHYTNNEVRKVDVNSGADSLLTTLDGPWSILVDGDYLYVGARPDYCANNEGRLYRVPLAGGEPTLLADNLNCPSQLARDSKGLYWINTGSWQGPDSGEPAPADGSVMHLPRR